MLKGSSNTSMMGRNGYGGGIPPNMSSSPQFPFMGGRNMSSFSGMGFPAPNPMSREPSMSGAFMGLNPTKIGGNGQTGFIPTTKNSNYSGIPR